MHIDQLRRMSIPELFDFALSDIDDAYFWFVAGVLTAAIEQKHGMDSAMKLAEVCGPGDRSAATQRIIEMKLAGTFTGERRSV